MAKKVLTPEEKAAQDAAKKAAQEAAENPKQGTPENGTPENQNPKQSNSEDEKAKGHKDEHSELDERIRSAFENFPTADKLYVDGEELFFAQVKANMRVVQRADFISKTDKQ